MNKVFIGSILLCVIFQEVHNLGSVNTYADTTTRVTPFVAKIIRKSCRLKPDPGPCRANIPMYYFNPEGAGCVAFRWGGCQGNGNRFDSKKECEEKCLSTNNEEVYRPKYCELTYDYGYCFGFDKRWYYDNLWKVCKERLYSGCGGNKNNFYNKENCDSVCRFGRGPLVYTTDKSNWNKILIVNPTNATPGRGRDQRAANDTGANVIGASAAPAARPMRNMV